MAAMVSHLLEAWSARQDPAELAESAARAAELVAAISSIAKISSPAEMGSLSTRRVAIERDLMSRFINAS